MLNETQKKMVVEAIGDGSDWPKMTKDPRVNHAVDVEVCGMRPWEELSDETRKAYIEEAMEGGNYEKQTALHLC